MMPSSVFIIVGPSAAGKTTLAAMLSDLLGERVVNSGDLLRAYMRAEAVEVDDELATGEIFLHRFNERIAGEVIVRGAKTAGATIIDGVRLFSSLDAFASRGIEPQIVVVSTSLRIRHARLTAESARRGETTPAVSTADRLDRKAAWDGDLPNFRRLARWQFENDGPLKSLTEFARLLATESR